MVEYILCVYLTIFLSNMRKLFYLSLVIILLFFTSCFKDDERIIPIEIDEIEIPFSVYEYQTYYNISDGSVVSHNHYSEWDLGFESSTEGYHIILNYSRFMYAGNTFDTDFYSVTSNNADEMLFDNSSGNLDSTVFIDWVDFTDSENPIFSKNVYIVDRGKNELGEEFGLKKIVFEKLEEDTFYIHYANLDNTEDHFYKIPKDSNVNFALFSLEDEGNMVVQEPDKLIWDICFTKYSTIIPDDFGVPTDYLVRGVLLNPNKNIEVALDTVNYFYNITFDIMLEYTYLSTRDAIGYDWKVFTNDFYTIRENNSYILRDVNGVSYKIRFTDFYNDIGEKGFPAFEIKELE